MTQGHNDGPSVKHDYVQEFGFPADLHGWQGQEVKGNTIFL